MNAAAPAQWKLVDSALEIRPRSGEASATPFVRPLGLLRSRCDKSASAATLCTLGTLFTLLALYLRLFCFYVNLLATELRPKRCRSTTADYLLPLKKFIKLSIRVFYLKCHPVKTRSLSDRRRGKPTSAPQTSTHSLPLPLPSERRAK